MIHGVVQKMSKNRGEKKFGRSPWPKNYPEFESR